MDQRVALVTGASRGIGRGIALRLAAQGRAVAMVARTEGPLNEVRAEIERGTPGAMARVYPADMADLASVEATVERVIAEMGRLDVLVNNAGITRDGLALRMSNEDFAGVIQVNLTAVFVACRVAARAMMKGKFGRIVNIGSTSGLVGNAGQANYAAAKSGLIGLTRSLARELGAKGITANVIAPGFIETDMTAGLPQEVRDKVLSAMAVRRFGTVDDIAGAVAYVSGDETGFLTGQVIAVDGGLTMC